METKHTPGPWNAHWYETNKRTHTGRWYFVGQDEGQFAGHTKNVSLVSKTGAAEANAKLIAAAPEMLEALRAIESCLSPADCDRAANLVRDAIKKAEGH